MIRGGATGDFERGFHTDSQSLAAEIIGTQSKTTLHCRSAEGSRGINHYPEDESTGEAQAG